MSRFMDGDEEFPGQWWLWEQALDRAMNGAKGQRVMKELEQALLELPEKALIDGRLSDGSGVCAVGAYIARKRVQAGEDRAEVLEDLVVAPDAWGDIDGWEAEEQTILRGQAAGMQLTLACTIASLNDDHYKATPEERYSHILEWVQKRIVRPLSGEVNA